MSEFSELGMSVLVCGTSRPLRQALQASLRAMGCKAVSDAETIDDMDAVLASQHIDVALIGDNAEISFSDGLQTRRPDLPIVCLTHENSTAGSGMHSLKKPFRPDDLTACLGNLATAGERFAPAAIAI